MLTMFRAVPGNDPVRAMRGDGGLRYPGRWHTAGKPVVYLASQASLAMLEILVNTTAEDLVAREYHVMRVEVPEEGILDVPHDQLPGGWNAPQRVPGTMLIGDRFLAARERLALKVPSAVVPLGVAAYEYNLVLNPLHPTISDVRVVDVMRLPFDQRLK